MLGSVASGTPGISLSSSYNEKYLRQKFVEKLEKRILCSIIIFRKPCPLLMWKNILECGRPQMAIWRIRIAYWIPKATNTHTQVM